MTKSIKIGRTAEFTVEKTYTDVGREHAEITREPDGIYIKDLDSKGGTFVNDKRVLRKKIGASDKVRLASSYILDVNEVLKKMPMSDEDFKKGFMKLKPVYEKFQKDKTDIHTDMGGSAITQILPILGAPFMMGGGLMMRGDGNEGWGIALMVVGIAVVIIGLVMKANVAKSKRANMDKLLHLTEQYKIDYSCPACQRHFPEIFSWESLKRQGKCPHCGRKFGV